MLDADNIAWKFYRETIKPLSNLLKPSSFSVTPPPPLYFPHN